MTTIRSAKNKGAQMEYSVRDSLLPIFPDILLTKQLGFVSQYDLVSHKERLVFECKKHRHFDWNELVKYFDKLNSKTPTGYFPILVFQANRQPCLIMFYHHDDECMSVIEFESYFHTQFIKHVGDKHKSKEVNKNGTDTMV